MPAQACAIRVCGGGGGGGAVTERSVSGLLASIKLLIELVEDPDQERWDEDWRETVLASVRKELTLWEGGAHGS